MPGIQPTVGPQSALTYHEDCYSIKAVVLKAFSLRTPLHLKIIKDPKSFYLCGLELSIVILGKQKIFKKC